MAKPKRNLVIVEDESVPTLIKAWKIPPGGAKAAVEVVEGVVRAHEIPGEGCLNIWLHPCYDRQGLLAEIRAALSDFKDLGAAEWQKAGDIPAGCMHLMRAYHDLFGLHNANNLVRLMDGPGKRVCIERHGKVESQWLTSLAELGPCFVEVEALAPGHILIIMYGQVPPSGVPRTPYKEISGFLFRSI